MVINIYLFATEEETRIDAETVCPLHYCALAVGLAPMAHEAGVKGHLWYPEDHNIARAGFLLDPVGKAIKAMEADPARFRGLEAPHLRRSYADFLTLLKGLFTACQTWPNAYVRVSR